MKSDKGYTLIALRRIAMADQVEDESKPWTYTDKCHMCGGVKAFLDWLEEQEESFNALEVDV